MEIEPEVQTVAAGGYVVYNVTVRGHVEEWANLTVGIEPVAYSKETELGFENLTLSPLPKGVTAKIIDAVPPGFSTQLVVKVSPSMPSSQFTVVVAAEERYRNNNTSARFATAKLVIATPETSPRTTTTKTGVTQPASTITTVTETKTNLESEGNLLQSIVISIGIAVSGIAIALAILRRRREQKVG